MKSIILIIVFVLMGLLNLNGQWKIQNIQNNYGYISSAFFFDSLNGLGIAKKLLRTSDGGKTWIAKNSAGFTAYSRIYSVSKNNLLLISDNKSLLSSTDGGESWKEKQSDMNIKFINLSFFDENQGLAIGYNVSDNNQIIIYKTTDGGATWAENIYCPINKKAFSINCTSNKTAYFSGVNLIYKTIDGGLSWNLVDIGANFIYYNFVNSCFLSDSVGFYSGSVLTKNDTINYKSVTFKTIDGGKSWKCFDQYKRAIQFADKSNGYAFDIYSKIFRTTDLGETWTEITPANITVYMAAMAVFSPDKAIFFGQGEVNKVETRIRTSDGGKSWERLDSGRLYKFNTIRFLNKKTGWGAGLTGEIYKTINGGSSWEQQKQSVEGEYIRTIYFLDTLCGWYLSGKSGFSGTTIVRTTNGGKSWDSLFSFPYTIFSVYFLDKLSGYICGSGGRIYSTTNGGKTWKFIETPLSNMALTKIVFSDKQHGWATGERYSIIRTMDGGKTWTICRSTSGRYYDVVFADSLIGWATGISNTTDVPFVRTTDGGTTWQEIRQRLPATTYELNFPSVKVGYAIGYNGVICKTIDSGATWRQLKFPVTSHINSISFADELTGWAATEDGYIIYTTNGGEEFPISVPEEKNNVPNGFNLSQNYPNPFNPTTTIKYSIPIESKVTLILYNTLGQKIKEIVNETKPAGTYDVMFDGAGWPSGIYFFQLNAGSFSQTKKLILLK